MEEGIPIKVVAEKTGLSNHVLRIWERRYRVINPTRTPTNRRVYNQSDIEKLLILKRLTQAGYQIGHLSELDQEALENLNKNLSIKQNTSNDFNHEISETIEHLKTLDAHRLNAYLENLLATYSQLHIIEAFIPALLKTIGDQWEHGELRITHEHLLSESIKKLLSLINAQYAPTPNARLVLTATPSGAHHALGAQLVSKMAELRGLRSVFLGACIPNEELIYSARTLKADILALSLICIHDHEPIKTSLTFLKNHLPNQTQLIVGGQSCFDLQETLKTLEITTFSDLTSFHDFITLMK